MPRENINSLVVLGPTASGKTALGVKLARLLGGEILSVDSRQVYRGLDIGSGKDLSEYGAGKNAVPYHLIDIVDLSSEFSVFDFQNACFDAWEDVRGRGALPVLVGGTGLYLEAALSAERMVPVPEDTELRKELEALSDEALAQRLRDAKPDTHNTTDFTERDRTVRAIEIAVHSARCGAKPAPPIRPLVLGIQWDREILRRRITARLRARLEEGMIDEVEQLHDAGWSWERLERLGLEYRLVSCFLRGQIRNRNDLFQKLNTAIHQFAKRQETWYRRMERRGQEIHWVSEARLDPALAILRKHSIGADYNEK